MFQAKKIIHIAVIGKASKADPENELKRTRGTGENKSSSRNK